MQPQHGPAVALAGRGRVNAQEVANLLVGKPFEVPQEQDFPIHVGKLRHGEAEPLHQLAAAYLVTGR